ncbi:hypothetical protein CARUB_v10019622mg [Capsella rubella]|uniref:Uncharacterized protein n=1 Tax=Capsella rubella TaxID=81985 RepID=R0H9W5_9BRAS|nr:hypothetical protein CARUB_v10019622mg [Capsella rubella]
MLFKAIGDDVIGCVQLLAIEIEKQVKNFKRRNEKVFCFVEWKLYLLLFLSRKSGCIHVVTCKANGKKIKTE